jgi:hypothetical protein
MVTKLVVPPLAPVFASTASCAGKATSSIGPFGFGATGSEGLAPPVRKNEHTMTTHFGPELAKKVCKQHRGTGNCHPKGQPKSEAMDDDELELDVLACINDVASPWDLLATCCCSGNFI